MFKQKKEQKQFLINEDEIKHSSGYRTLFAKIERRKNKAELKKILNEYEV